MKRDDIKEFIELMSGYSKSSKMLVEAEEDEEETEGEDSEDSEDSDKEEKDPDEEKLKISQEEEVELNKSLDDALEAMFVDIESDALKSAQLQSESLTLKLLYEEAQIDVETFAAETARVIKNADVLLDIEKIILSKAREYIVSKYDEEVEQSFLDIMKNRHSIDHRTEDEKKEAEEQIQAPLAVGASGGEGGA